jgi:GTPase SAR1 family protein
MKKKENLEMKFIVVGDSAVGTTSIIQMFNNDVFEKDREPTVGVDVNAFHMDIDGNPVSLQVWDTAGQEKYKSLSRSYYRDAIGVFFVFAYAKVCSLSHLNLNLSLFYYYTNLIRCFIKKRDLILKISTNNYYISRFYKI